MLNCMLGSLCAGKGALVDGGCFESLGWDCWLHPKMGSAGASAVGRLGAHRMLVVFALEVRADSGEAPDRPSTRYGI